MTTLITINEARLEFLIGKCKLQEHRVRFALLLAHHTQIIGGNCDRAGEEGYNETFFNYRGKEYYTVCSTCANNIKKRLSKSLRFIRKNLEVDKIFFDGGSAIKYISRQKKRN